jgi:hypothetical protein
MHTNEDATFNRLKRPSFGYVRDLIYAANPHRSLTFIRMNPVGKWQVSEAFHQIVLDNNWTIEDFNKELDNRESSRK